MAWPLLSIPRAAAMVGVSLDVLRREIASGDVPTVRVGQRDLVDPDDLSVSMSKLFDGNPQEINHAM
jgi:hypothetical protein